MRVYGFTGKTMQEVVWHLGHLVQISAQSRDNYLFVTAQKLLKFPICLVP